MKTIITIQHTQSIHHTNGMVGSWSDWDLSETGLKQAQRIGQKLSIEFAGKNFVLYSSDLKRASQTADIIGKYMSLTPLLASELRERNLGRCVGESVQWLRENMECQEKTVDDRMFHDAESRRDEWNRLRPFYDKIVNSSDESIMIVSHGDLLSVFNAMWLGLDVESLNTAELFGLAGGVSFMFENNEGKRIIKRLSDMSYISE
jgi:probable phosphoglycerate mutase